MLVGARLGVVAWVDRVVATAELSGAVLGATLVSADSSPEPPVISNEPATTNATAAIASAPRANFAVDVRCQGSGEWKGGGATKSGAAKRNDGSV
jgi:hypothetical protein